MLDRVGGAIARVIHLSIREVSIMTYGDRIVIDPEILVGKPVIKSTRLAVEFIIELLANGWSHDDILKTTLD